MGTTRRNKPARASQLAFEALSIEGGLLSPEWLAKLAQLGAGQQGEADYRVPKGLNLRDEIGRYWRIAQAWWADFDLGRTRNADPVALSERFVTVLLTDVLGFTSLKPSQPVEREGRLFPITAFARGTRVPVVIAPAGAGLDAPSPRFGEGGRRRSAFGLAQEFLNATDEALWGIASDGVTLRIVRDNASLTRPAWIEADLGRIFAEERYADFAALWLLAHETRFGSGESAPAECPLEVWRGAGREEGTRAREHLRRGVEEALLAFGQGFVAHPENGALRAAMQRGDLTPMALYQELLRLAYRLIFLLTVEERGVLHAPDAPAAARELYDQGYSLRRLRERAVRRNAHDRFADLWEGLKIVFHGVARGELRLALPALGGLFERAQCPSLDGARLANSFLLAGLFRLSWIVESSGLSRVNWRDMGPEELGSVYESLLELVPQISLDERRFTFASGDETKGNARKTSGSYYTPDSLVQVLLDSALEPVVKDTLAAHPANPVEALLSLSVVDPACGSGHFLLAAARRLAGHVARLQASGTPSAAEYRHALRQVVGRCIYGVDLNPMALELCRVGLWMEAVEPGLALSFLDSHIQHGNALLGTTPELMAKGIPDAAWEPIEGDDKKVASALKKRNKAESKGQQVFDFSAQGAGHEADEVTRAVEALDQSPDADLDAVGRKSSQWEAIRASQAYQHQRFVADAWCAAFVWPKQPGPLVDAAPTNGLWAKLRDGRGEASSLTEATVRELAAQYQFFHWHLAFPQVFKRGGFDVVLGNPPWERVKLQEQEFFASRSDVIATAVNAAARKKLIAKLPAEDPVLWAAWSAASRKAEGESHSIRQSGRYPLCGKGDVNTYAIFAEHNRNVLGPRGRAGFIAPTGIATDDTTSEYFGTLVTQHELARFYSFENEGFIFPGVHHAFKFALLSIARAGNEPFADLTFFIRTVLGLADNSRHFSLSPTDFETLNPNSRTCPTFRSKRDANLNLAIYRRVGVFQRDTKGGSSSSWDAQARTRTWHMAEDAEWFRRRIDLENDGWHLEGASFVKSSAGYCPLFEAKMIHHFDHRFGTYDGQSSSQDNQGKLPEFDDLAHADPKRFVLPCYWVPSDEANARLEKLSSRQWLLGWRDICRSTDQRTLIAAIFPRAAAGNTMPLLFVAQHATYLASLYANLCAFIFDYTTRQKIGGTHLTFNYLKQLPVLPTSTYEVQALWSRDASVRDWLLPRVLELTYTAWDLEPFARDVGYDGAPFRWDPERRTLLRAELDAAFFHLYGLSRDDTDYVMETFPIVRKNDEKAHGEYRTKRLILEVYDAMAEATRTGKAYVTRLDPPPADPRVAHSETRKRAERIDSSHPHP